MSTENETEDPPIKTREDLVMLAMKSMAAGIEPFGLAEEEVVATLTLLAIGCCLERGRSTDHLKELVDLLEPVARTMFAAEKVRGL